MFKLLSTGNPKTLKGMQQGYMTYILHLAPADLSGYEVCPKRTAGCTAACLNTAGRGGMFKPGGTNTIQQARIRKAKYFFEDREGFLRDLAADITKAVKQAERKGLVPVFRLNGTSDLSWEKYGIIQKFPTVQFYDYTKVLGRKVEHLPNYHLTFSRAENNDADVVKAVQAGMNVAAVYDRIPDNIFSADDSDLRFLDPQVGVVGLKAKGRAKKDYSGFVIRIAEVDKVGKTMYNALVN
jgi:hypothetical protein